MSTDPTSAYCRLLTEGDLNDDKLVLIEDYVSGLEMQDWKTGFGEPAQNGWPDDATIKLRKTSGRKLTDLLGTITNNLVVSKGFRDLLEDKCGTTKVEYLPVRIHDFRDRLVSDEYVIVNPLGTVDCLDLEESDIVWSKDDPTKPVRVKAMVLSAKKVQHAPAVFRVKERPVEYIVSPDVAAAIRDRGFSNVRLQTLKVR